MRITIIEMLIYVKSRYQGNHEYSLTAGQVVVKKERKRFYHYPPVPKHMGWNWEAEDIPGMKVRRLLTTFKK